MVTLQRLEIEHYRGGVEKQSINFAVPKEDRLGSGLTLIVGPNNTGKTSIIESLLLNANSKFKIHERHANFQPKILIKSDAGTCVYTNRDGGSQVSTQGSQYMLLIGLGAVDRGDYIKYGIEGNEHRSDLLGDGIISLFRICAHLN